MKTVLFLISFCLITVVTNAQENATANQAPKPQILHTQTLPHVMPHLKSCLPYEPEKQCTQYTILEYFKKNLRYPKKAKENGVKGHVLLAVTISKEGKFDDIKVIHHLDDECDQEAIRLVKEIPQHLGKWIPGSTNQKSVEVVYNMLVKFE